MILSPESAFGGSASASLTKSSCIFGPDLVSPFLPFHLNLIEQILLNTLFEIGVCSVTNRGGDGGVSMRLC